MGNVFRSDRFKNPHAKHCYLAIKEEYDLLVKKRSKFENAQFLQLIQKLLQNSPQLVRDFNILLSDASVSNTGAIVISRAILRPDVRIVKIEMNNVKMTALGAKEFGAMLGRNNFTEIVSLSGNNIGREGSIAIIEGLRNNTSVKKLCINNVKGGDDMYVTLGKILAVNHTIDSIESVGNMMGEAGLTSLLLSLLPTSLPPEKRAAAPSSPSPINSSFVFLTFSSDLPPARVAPLLNVLERNSCLKDIWRGLLTKCVQRQFRTKMNTFKRSVKQRSGASGLAATRGPVGGDNNISFKVLASMKQREDQGLQKVTSVASEASLKTVHIFGMAETIGRRAEMQDVSRIVPGFRGKKGEELYMVFDGHGSREPSKYCALNFPDLFEKYLNQHGGKEGQGEGGVTTGVVYEGFRSVFSDLNRQISPWSPYSGTTALVMYVAGNTVYVSNVGDTRCVVNKNGEAVRMSVDHRPDNPEEGARIVSTGGYVQDKRVNALLSVSRALGDSLLQPFVSCEPYTTMFECTEEFSSCVLGCDGVYDVLSDEQVIALVATERDPNVAAAKVRDNAYESGSGDNISVICVYFKNANH